MAGEKTGTGLEPNVAGLLCYVLIWVTGLIFYLIEKENRFVRFHAMQSIIVFGTLTVASLILGVIPIIGWVISWLLGIAAPPGISLRNTSERVPFQLAGSVRGPRDSGPLSVFTPLPLRLRSLQ